MNPYKSILCICKLKLNEEGTTLELNLPFKIYGQNIVMQGKDITYRLNDLSNVNKEVLAKVDYCLEDMPGTDIKGEKVVAEAYAGNLGNDWKNIKKDLKYLKHYSVTKKNKLTTYDEEGTKIEYNGVDKDEVTKFCEWDVIEEAII